MEDNKINQETKLPYPNPERKGYPHCPEQYRKLAEEDELIRMYGCNECPMDQDCESSPWYIWDHPDIVEAWKKEMDSYPSNSDFDSDDDDEFDCCYGDDDQTDDMRRINSCIDGGVAGGETILYPEPFVATEGETQQARIQRLTEEIEYMKTQNEICVKADDYSDAIAAAERELLLLLEENYNG